MFRRRNSSKIVFPINKIKKLRDVLTTSLNKINQKKHSLNQIKTISTEPSINNIKTKNNFMQKNNLPSLSLLTEISLNIEKEKQMLQKDYDLLFKKIKLKARLFKLMKNNIILKEKDYTSLYTKYYEFAERNNNNKFFDSKNINKTFVTKKTSNSPLFLEYKPSMKFLDYHLTARECLNKGFSNKEKNILYSDPIFFRLNKEPFLSLRKKIKLSLKQKLNIEQGELFKKHKNPNYNKTIIYKNNIEKIINKHKVEKMKKIKYKSEENKIEKKDSCFKKFYYKTKNEKKEIVDNDKGDIECNNFYCNKIKKYLGKNKNIIENTDKNVEPFIKNQIQKDKKERRKNKNEEKITKRRQSQFKNVLNLIEYNYKYLNHNN